MPIEVFELKFKGPVHFGRKRLSDSEMTVAADTLFSALFIETLQLNMSTDWLLNDIVISDTFPFENEVYYLPKPLVKIISSEEGNHKDFKKLKYIPVHNFKEYLNGQLTAEDAKDLNEIFDIGQYTLHTKVSLLEQSKDLSADSEPYSIGTFKFFEDTGLYFIAKASDHAMKQLKVVLDSLQYSGLGGKRTAGYGQFEYTTSMNNQIRSLLQNNGKQKILLSTAMATSNEIEKSCEDARYILKKRSGFIQSSDYSDNLVKKNDFYSFAPGSVFTNTFKGDVFNVGTEGSHPVYRYAKPLWLEV